VEDIDSWSRIIYTGGIMKEKITQREWDRAVGIGAPPDDQLIPNLPEYELDKTTGEVIKVTKPEPEIKYKWEESDFD
jgi:hypothetical protein